MFKQKKSDELKQPQVWNVNICDTHWMAHYLHLNLKKQNKKGKGLSFTLTTFNLWPSDLKKQNKIMDIVQIGYNLWW